MQKVLSWNELKGIREQAEGQGGRGARRRCQGSWQELLGPMRNSDFSLSDVTSTGFPKKEEVGRGLSGTLGGRSFHNRQKNEF